MVTSSFSSPQVILPKLLVQPKLFCTHKVNKHLIYFLGINISQNHTQETRVW